MAELERQRQIIRESFGLANPISPASRLAVVDDRIAQIEARQAEIQSQRELKFQQEEKADPIISEEEALQQGLADIQRGIQAQRDRLLLQQQTGEQLPTVQQAASAALQARDLPVISEEKVAPSSVVIEPQEVVEDESFTPPSSPVQRRTRTIFAPSSDPFISRAPSPRRPAQRRPLPPQRDPRRPSPLDISLSQREQKEPLTPTISIAALSDFGDFTPPEGTPASSPSSSIASSISEGPKVIRVPVRGRARGRDLTLEEKERQVAVERKEGPPLTVQETLRRALTTSHPPVLFKTNTFSPDIIRKTITNSLDRGNIVNRDTLRKKIENLVEIGLQQAIPTGSDREVNGVFASVAEALNLVGRNIFNPDDLATIANEAAFNVLGKEAFQTLTRPPGLLVNDIPRMLNDLFGRNVRLLRKKKLTDTEINNITNDFVIELEQAQIHAEDFVQNLRETERALNNIQDPRLKSVLQSHIRFLINKEQREQRIEIARLPSILIPSSANRLVRITRESRDHLIDPIDQQLNRIGDVSDIDQEEAVQILDNLEGNINAFNAALVKHNIQIVQQGTLKPFQIKIDENDTVSDRLQNLSDARQILSNEQFTFVHLPVIAEGRQLTADSVGKTFRSDVDKVLRSKQKKLELKRLADQSSQRNFGQVEVLSRKGTLHKELEIVIPPNAVLEDLIKVAMSLTVDGGVLENVKGKVLLKIIPNVTTFEEILRIFMHEQRRNLKHTVRIVYIPVTHVGGSLVGGALSAIHKRSMGVNDFIKPSGIPMQNFRRDILNTPFKNLHRFPHDESNMASNVELQHPSTAATDFNQLGGNIPATDGLFHFQVEPIEPFVSVEDQNFGGSIDDRVTRDIPFSRNVGVVAA